MIEQLKFWFYRKAHDGIPHPEEVVLSMADRKFTNKIDGVGKLYANIGDARLTAKNFGVTHERVRRILIKICRNHLRLKDGL